MTWLKPHSRFGWRRDERLRPPFIPPPGARPSHTPSCGNAADGCEEPRVGLCAPTRGPDPPVHKRSRGPARCRASSAQGGEGGQTRSTPCRAQGRPRFTQETASAGRHLVQGRAAKCQLQGASRDVGVGASSPSVLSKPTAGGSGWRGMQPGRCPGLCPPPSPYQ